MARRRSGEACRTFVCAECAAERARVYSDNSLDFARIRGAGRVDEADSLRCPLCGSIVVEANPEAAPGCCDCYVEFSEVFRQAVQAAQGCGRHVGKTPGR